MMRRLLALCVVIVLAGVACEEPPETEPFARGRQLYGKLDCGRCHHIDGQGGRVGPDLTRVGSVAASRSPGMTADEYLRRSIADPGSYIVPGFPDVMPRGMARGLSEADLDALVHFLSEHK
jgi:cytochrome c553